MKIMKLRTNHLDNPIGYRMNRVSLSWVVTDAKGDRAVKARVQLSQDEAFSTLIFDSGEQENINPLGYVLNLELKEATRYYWRVQVWDDAGDTAVSETAFFETAAQLRQAKWIQAPFDQTIHPLLRKEVQVRGAVERARLYITGLGVYEAWINGEKVSDEYLAPFYNDYNLWTQYQTYDVTGQLAEGANVLGVMLGNGWYKGRFGFVDKMDCLYGDEFKLLCELHLDYADGSKEVVCSDESWLCAPSPQATLLFCAFFRTATRKKDAVC